MKYAKDRVEWENKLNLCTTVINAIRAWLELSLYTFIVTYVSHVSEKTVFQRINVLK